MLAKLTRPRLQGALQRGRLFAMLDQARQRRVVWISAPAGAGKTTLIASFIEHRDSVGPWAQLDAGDADAPTFFYYLGLAMQSVMAKDRRNRNTVPLPILTPEFLADLPGFARRFFRELFARLPTEGTVVLDNFHTIPDTSVLHGALAEAFDAIPDGANVFVISREDPPAAFSRLRANETLHVIGWDPLKLTLEETRDIVLGERAIDAAALAALHGRCGGWAAGLRLLLESPDDIEHVDMGTAQGEPQTLNHYFATQVFASLSAAQQALLLRLAYLPTIHVGAAQALTGDANIGQLFELMLKRHLFIVKLAAQSPTYRFHDLFRAFLRQHVEHDYSDEQARAQILTTAGLLRDLGDVDNALALYLQAEHWGAVTELILQNAAALIKSGRWRVLMDWIHQMPSAHYQADRRLLCWLGVAQMSINPAEARIALEAAYVLADAQGDVNAVLEIAAAMVQSHMLEYTQFKPLDRWTPVLERAITESVTFPNAEAEPTQNHAAG